MHDNACARWSLLNFKTLHRNEPCVLFEKKFTTFFGEDGGFFNLVEYLANVLG